MSCILYALLLSCAILQAGDAFPTAARSLYAEAAAAIESGRTAEAIAALEALQENYADSQPSRIAQPHLAECYLIEKRPRAALDILEPLLQANPSEHVVRLLVAACGALADTHESIDRIEQCLSRLPADDTLSQPVRESLLMELVRRHEALHEFDSAIACWDRIPTLAKRTPTNGDRRFQLMLAWAHEELSGENTVKALELLESLLDSNLSDEQYAAVRFSLAEALIKHGERERALGELAQLSKLAHASADGAVPEWAASVELRRAELLLKMRRTPAAMEVLGEALQSYPSFVKVHELHFLMARCAIATVDFDLAMQHLQMIRESELPANSEAMARAVWMQGEINFLRHEFREALAHYQKVIECDECPQWQARALLQAGKCRELLAQPQEALVLYQRLQQQCGQAETQPATWAASLREQADERIALLSVDPIH